MKFEILGSKTQYNGIEEYSIKENAFECIPWTYTDIGIFIAYLELRVDSENMLVKYVSGFSPRESWKDMKLTVPSAVEGSIRLLGEYEASMAYRLGEIEMWKSYFDKVSGWFCIGNPITKKHDNAIKIADGLIVVLDKKDSLQSVWIKPIFVE